MRTVESFAAGLFARFGDRLELATAADLNTVADDEIERLSAKFYLPEPPPDTGIISADGVSRNECLNHLLAALLRGMDSVPPDDIMILMFACIMGAVLPDV